MGNYTIRLSPHASKLCSIVVPWGTYEYLRLPMGIMGAPDIFQEKMSKLMSDLEWVRTYLDDLLTITKGSFDDHLLKLERVLQRLSDANLKVNAPKCEFCQKEIHYLGFLLRTDGIKPLPDKIQAIQRLKRPTNRKQLLSFLGLVNYYRDMWKRRSHILTPLTFLLKKDVPFKWTEEQEAAFLRIKEIICADVMLAFPQFGKKFILHTDASKFQLGAVIMQDDKPIAFYSRKLTETQQKYTVGEIELLSVVETLKEFRNILFGQDIEIHTDHINNVNIPTSSKLGFNRIQRWRWLIEEFNPTFIYLPGKHNIIADALSRLETSETETPLETDLFAIMPEETTAGEIISHSLAHIDMDAFVFENEEELFYQASIEKSNSPSDNALFSYPLTLSLIAAKQVNDALLHKLRSKSPEHFSKYPKMTKSDLWMYRDKIYNPAALQQQVLRWYHEMLCHPGINRMKYTIAQHLTWPTLNKNVEEYVQSCHNCQVAKSHRGNYGKLPSREANVRPWHTLCVDCIGPYKVKGADGKIYELHAMTMADPVTGWFEISEIADEKAETAARVLDRSWLCRYPRPEETIYDNASNFLGERFQELLDSYGINPVPTTVRNPQANFVERVHETLGNMLRTMILENYDFDPADPWTDILSHCAWAIRSTMHMTMGATPAQLVFGRDMLFDLSYAADWDEIKAKKERSIQVNNERENRKRKAHTFHAGDQILLKRGKRQPKLNPLRDGPYSIVKVYTNGTVKISKSPVLHQVVSIRNIMPYRS